MISRTKKILSTLIIVISMIFLVTANAGVIANTPHDLSSKGWGTTETCKFCHTPHNAQAVVGAPLWNHQTTVATYTLYSTATFKGTSTQPGPTSMLCLSCHDGTVAVDSFGSAGTLQSGTHFVSATNTITKNKSLANDHPISFNYDSALVALDSHLVTPASDKYVDAAQQIPLFASKLECASCHEPHDNVFGKFLRINNDGSQLCTKCHIK